MDFHADALTDGVFVDAGAERDDRHRPVADCRRELARLRDGAATERVEHEVFRLGAPRPLGVALRARALIAPPPDQIELLGAAVQLLRATPAKLDCARALCDLGAATRRSGSRNQAREPLQEALQLAHECGAVALAGRARHELIVLGARPRRHAVTGVEALTARERQASELAAEGLTNRQIAESIHLAEKTVKNYVSNLLAKLGMERRTQAAVYAVGLRDEGLRHP